MFSIHIIGSFICKWLYTFVLPYLSPICRTNKKSLAGGQGHLYGWIGDSDADGRKPLMTINVARQKIMLGNPYFVYVSSRNS